MEKIIEFIKLNGWTLEDENDDYKSFSNGDAAGIDIDANEIVLIDAGGDFCHLPLNLYALIGALIVHRQISIIFKMP